MNIRTHLEPLTAVVTDHRTATTVLALAMALFIASPIVAGIQAALTATMAVAGLHWQVGIVLAATWVVWLVHAWIYPERNCLWCHGKGRFAVNFLLFKVSRACRRCGGSGRRTRLGRRLLNPVIGTH